MESFIVGIVAIAFYYLAMKKCQERAKENPTPFNKIAAVLLTVFFVLVVIAVI